MDIDSTSSEVGLHHKLTEERDFWKGMALYLADCHAATATYDGELKSCSKSRQERLVSICKTAAEAIREGRLLGRRLPSREDVLGRLDKVIQAGKA